LFIFTTLPEAATGTGMPDRFCGITAVTALLGRATGNASQIWICGTLNIKNFDLWI